MTSPTAALRLSLPATSANLGPGFDAVGLALSLYLSIEASPGPAFTLSATGRDTELVGRVENNLILDTYTDVLRQHGLPSTPLALQIHNEIPLGMGLGSSAAALCAGVLLANHFGSLGWSLEKITHEAAGREGHPDNVAACLHGGLTVSRTLPTHTATATFGVGLPWRLLLALPQTSLATHAARALLPDRYSRADAVANIQATALLLSAFALGRPELLRSATGDRIHQPYRRSACPLFAAVESLATHPHVFSVTLSGAGPSTLFIVDETFDGGMLEAASGPLLHEVLSLSISCGGIPDLLSHRLGGKLR